MTPCHPLANDRPLFGDLLDQVEPRTNTPRSVMWILRSYHRQTPREGPCDIRVAWTTCWTDDVGRLWNVECWHYRYHWLADGKRGRRLWVAAHVIQRRFATREEAVERAVKVIAAHDRAFKPQECEALA